MIRGYITRIAKAIYEEGATFVRYMSPNNMPPKPVSAEQHERDMEEIGRNVTMRIAGRGGGGRSGLLLAMGKFKTEKERLAKRKEIMEHNF